MHFWSSVVIQVGWSVGKAQSQGQLHQAVQQRSTATAALVSESENPQMNLAGRNGGRSDGCAAPLQAEPQIGIGDARTDLSRAIGPWIRQPQDPLTRFKRQIHNRVYTLIEGLQNR